MRGLPALVDETAMVAAVSDWIAVVEQKMTATASREWLESTLRDFLRQGLIETLRVIEAAEAGDEIAHAALCRVCAEMLDQGKMPPAALRAYGERALVRGPVTRSAGRSEHDNWRRDIGVACLVYLARERFGLSPSRNREQRRRCQPSACSIVALALGRRRINITEKRIENIWAGLRGQVAAFVIGLESPSILPI
jgi:hypothetical protein